MPYSKIEDLPENIKKLPENKQRQWLQVFNSAYKKAKSEGKSDKECESYAFQNANSVVMKKASTFEMFIALSENSLYELKLLYCGKFDHALYGKFEVTVNKLKKAVTNFTAGIGCRKDEKGNYELPVNYQHASYNSDPEISKAAGWIKNLYLKGQELFASVEWTEKAKEYIKNKEFKFQSPEFIEEYKDENGKKYDFVILGAALTNVNFLKKNQLAIAMSDDSLLVCNETEESNMLEQKIRKILNLNETDDIEKSLTELVVSYAELEKQTQDLTDDVKKLTAQMKDSINDDKISLSELNEKVVKLTAEKSELEKKILLKEAEDMVTGAIEAGKLLPTQKDEWVKQYLTSPEFVKSQLEVMKPVIDLKESGSQGDGDKGKDDPTEELLEKAQKLAEEKKISLAEAQNIVLESDKGLAERYFDFKE